MVLIRVCYLPFFSRLLPIRDLFIAVYKKNQITSLIYSYPPRSGAFSCCAFVSLLRIDRRCRLFSLLFLSDYSEILSGSFQDSLRFFLANCKWWDSLDIYVKSRWNSFHRFLLISWNYSKMLIQLVGASFFYYSLSCVITFQDISWIRHLWRQGGFFVRLFNDSFMLFYNSNSTLFFPISSPPFPPFIRKPFVIFRDSNISPIYLKISYQDLFEIFFFLFRRYSIRLLWRHCMKYETGWKTSWRSAQIFKKVKWNRVVNVALFDIPR